MKKTAAGLAFISLALSACASGPERIENAAVPLSQWPVLPAPTPRDYGAKQSAYIMPGDQISVEVYGISELSREVTVDSDGIIDYPLIGEISAAGMARGELADIIESRLRGPYVRDPDVTVNLVSTAARIFTIDGAVAGPGNYPVVNDMTLMRAIAAAGGLSEDANQGDVVVFRSVEGQRIAGLYNLGDIRVGNYEDIAIYPTDVIIVGESTTSRLLRTFATGLPFILLVDRFAR